MRIEWARPVSLGLSVGTAGLAVVAAGVAGLGAERPGSLPVLALLVAAAVAYLLAYGHGIRRVRPRRPAGPSRGARARARAGPPSERRTAARGRGAGEWARAALLSLCVLHLAVLFLSGAVRLAGQLGLLPAGDVAARIRDAADMALILAVLGGWAWSCFLAFFCERCGWLILTGMAGALVCGWVLDAALDALLRAAYGGAGA